MFETFSEVPAYPLVFPIFWGAFAIFALMMVRRLRVFEAVHTGGPSALADIPARAWGVIQYAFLQTRSDALFDVGLELIKYGFAVLPPNEREERITRLIDACHEVAAASGTELARLLGLGDGVSRVEAHMLDEFNVRLRRRD